MNLRLFFRRREIVRGLEEQVADEKGIRAETLRRMLAKVDEFSESHRAVGLPDDLLAILKDDLEHVEPKEANTLALCNHA